MLGEFERVSVCVRVRAVHTTKSNIFFLHKYIFYERLLYCHSSMPIDRFVMVNKFRLYPFWLCVCGDKKKVSQRTWANQNRRAEEQNRNLIAAKRSIWVDSDEIMMGVNAMNSISRHSIIHFGGKSKSKTNWTRGRKRSLLYVTNGEYEEKTKIAEGLLTNFSIIFVFTFLFLLEKFRCRYIRHSYQKSLFGGFENNF